MQEVPALLSLPQNGLGSPVWIIMTGTTTALRGYNRLISKIVPLTAASRSADLIPYMVVSLRAGPSPSVAPHAHARWLGRECAVKLLCTFFSALEPRPGRRQGSHAGIAELLLPRWSL